MEEPSQVLARWCWVQIGLFKPGRCGYVMLRVRMTKQTNNAAPPTMPPMPQRIM
jgi:hypothetical protein